MACVTSDAVRVRAKATKAILEHLSTSVIKTPLWFFPMIVSASQSSILVLFSTTLDRLLIEIRLGIIPLPVVLEVLDRYRLPLCLKQVYRLDPAARALAIYL